MDLKTDSVDGGCAVRYYETRGYKERFDRKGRGIVD